MNPTYQHLKTFKGIDFTEQVLAGEYENCTFSRCHFVQANLSQIQYVDCTFEDCNFSMAKIGTTHFRNVQFNRCKLLGFPFEDCDPLLLSMQFDECQLNLASFYQLSLQNTTFKSCTLKKADFTKADLTKASFHNCDLEGAIFKNTILKQADFRTSYHFSIDPEINPLKKAKFSLTEVPGLLDKYEIEIE